MVTDLLACVKIRSATIDGKFGLGDPGETGQMYGYLIPFIYGLPPIPPVQIDIEPAFDRAVLTGRLALDISLTPIRLLAPIARFGWAIMGSTR